jgi:hypothetical protein
MPIATTASRMLQPGLTPCPACGDLQCLCRPRFFAGQLLTEEGLNRLDHYIVEKNKLHNRYLHGWGVACGLEVLCHPCEGFVTVTPGYALSPCGDDVVVCREEAVNICELLRKCREDKQRQWDCDPAFPRSEPNCDQDQEWVLYICYDEKPSRGIAALRGSSGPACCSRCSCGGSSSCGCGCHQTTNTHTSSSYRSSPRKPLPQCEPTVTCEGYTFQIRKAPQRSRIPNLGQLIHRIEDCLKELKELKQAVTKSALGDGPTLSTIQAIHQHLIAVLEQRGLSNCDLYRRVLQPLPFQPGQAAGGIPNSNNQVGIYFDPLLNEAMQECICSALLPPCPEPIEDNCVPLATVTVNCKSGCRIMKVCNWENRRFVPTVPNLGYWFGGFLRTAGVAEVLAELCCRRPQADDNPLLFPGGLFRSLVEAPSIFGAIKKQLQAFLTKLLS